MGEHWGSKTQDRGSIECLPNSKANTSRLLSSLTGLLQDSLVQNGTITLVSTVKGIHGAASPARAHTSNDRLPDLFVEPVGMSKDNGRSRLALAGCNASVGVACKLEWRG